MKTTAKQKTAGLSKKATLFINLYFALCLVVGIASLIINHT